MPYSSDFRWTSRRIARSCLALVLSVAVLSQSVMGHQPRRYDVVVAGGSTAALAAAVTAAKSGARTALIEPTDWVGGQITSSGVPAIDEAWHKIQDPDTGEVLVDVAAIARDPRNMTPVFRDMLLATGNPGRGWVSRFCFEPKPFLENHLEPYVEQAGPNLDVYLNTVLKRAEVDRAAGRVRAITVIERTPRERVAHGGYDKLPSQDLADWYSAEPSERFTKRIYRLEGRVFIDATEWGELLALAGATYRIGVERSDDSDQCDEQCGQAITFDFVQGLIAEPEDQQVEHDPVDHLGYGPYTDRPDAWQQIWTYRRIRGSEAAPAVGDLTIQNWGYSEKIGHGGNDYPFGYLFKTRDETAAEVEDWTGGIHLDVLAAAEQRALAWHTWLRDQAREPFTPGQIQLVRGALGTQHGLAKLPYIRDTRRSVGIDDFVLRLDDLTGEGASPTARVFDDRVALGAYAADIHPLVDCDYPDYAKLEKTTRPFTIPFRALTNRDYGNLLVAGKTMAQTFMANSATRLHPIEWSSGSAAGVAAGHMARTGHTAQETHDGIAELQELVRQVTPIDWTLP